MIAHHRLFLSKRTHLCGFALIFVLAAVSLLSIAIIGFMTHTMVERKIEFSSTGQSRADLLARTSLDIVLGDLCNEMQAGSTVLTSGTVSIFRPVANAAAMPSRVGDSSLPNVIKRSAGGSNFWYGTGYASTVFNPIRSVVGNGTTNAAINDRSISTNRWNATYLLGKTVPKAFVPPDWVILTRGGALTNAASPPTLASLSNRTPSNTSYAIGRYAYIIYDEGGLLDVNVAGNQLTTTENARRGFLHQATLTAIPGITDAAAFLSWRSPTTASNSAYLFSSTNTFLQIPSGDQRLVSRQDLIRLAKNGGHGLTTDALPYLGTFSREWNAPSWGPDSNAADFSGSSSYAYKNNRDTTTSTNRFVPHVRASDDFTITPSLADGTIGSSYSIGKNQPLLQRRSPLARLNWLGRNGPQNGGTTANIQAAFGLVWDNTNKRWNYCGPTGTSVQSSLSRLDQIAATTPAREPNFFELLKAAILSGSLGLNTGKTAMVQPTYFATSDMQIIQIGANLLDQYDADSYPSRFYFDTTLLCGSENIPLINKVVYTAYRPNVTTAGIPRGLVKAWVECEVWNPYIGPATDAPTSFRIKQEDGSYRMQINYDTDPKICYTAPSSAGSPSRLLTVTFPNLSGSTQDPKLISDLKQSGATVSGSDPQDIYDNIDSTGAYYVGFYSGEWLDSRSISDLRVGWEAAANIVLEYDYGGGNWLEVQRLPIKSGGNNLAMAVGSSGGGANSVTTPNIRFGCYGFLDPRTLRFGMNYLTRYNSTVSNGYHDFVNRTLAYSLTDTAQQFKSGMNPWGTSFTPSLNQSRSGDSISSTNTEASFRLADNRGSGGQNDPIYTDIDGVQRYGDQTWNTTTSTLGAFPMAQLSVCPQDRPVILNRPFRSVAEMGYAFRDLPFKSLDFFTSRSADAALLDFFCLNDPEPSTGLVGGKVNLNTRNMEVLKALLQGITRTETDPSTNQLSSADAQTVAQTLVTMTGNAATGPLVNKSELVTRFVENTGLTDVVKSKKEAAVRALAETGQTRTWNLLIDIIVQAGRYPTSATKLDQFMIEGERRYWLHVAIDRYTGKILDRQLEACGD